MGNTGEHKEIGRSKSHIRFSVLYRKGAMLVYLGEVGTLGEGI